MIGRSLLTLVLISCALASSATASGGGKIVVNKDEWPLSDR